MFRADAAVGGVSAAPFANVFSTLLFLAGEEAIVPEPACPDLSGVWHSEEYDVLQVASTGNPVVLSGLNMSLAIEQFPGHSDNCELLLENSWTYNGVTHVETMAGVIHSVSEDDSSARRVELTLVELPEDSFAMMTSAQLTVGWYPATDAVAAHMDFDCA